MDTVLDLIKAILLEKKVILIKSNTDNMAEIISALLKLIQPFKWYFPVITDLPANMIETLESP